MDFDVPLMDETVLLLVRETKRAEKIPLVLLILVGGYFI
jgi:hypothetical protein